jgi:hypothetical protein
LPVISAARAGDRTIPIDASVAAVVVRKALRVALAVMT